MLDKIEGKIKNIHLFIAIVALVVWQFIAPIISASVQTSSVEHQVLENTERISILENGYLSNREILLEIRYNVKTLVEDGGRKYLSADELPNVLIHKDKDAIK